jgi:hydroxymethylglutaryl-CoA reductase
MEPNINEQVQQGFLPLCCLFLESMTSAEEVAFRVQSSYFETDAMPVGLVTAPLSVNKKITPMIQDYHSFLKDTLFSEYLSRLTPETQPLWGKMNAQQMVEHLSVVFMLGNGKITATLIVTPEQSAKGKQAIMVDKKPFQKNITNELTGDTPKPLKYSSLSEAILKLKEQIELFYAYHREAHQVLPCHPIFGPLSFDEWTYFECKHCLHHLAQFGLVAEADAV